MNSRAGLLVQSGFLPNPVEDLPVQSAVVIQKGLQVREACEQDEKNLGRKESVSRFSMYNIEFI